MRALFSLRRALPALAAALVLVAALPADAWAQQRTDLPQFIFNPAYYSSRTAEKKSVMDGNEVAITFFNYGLLGGAGEIRGNWPKGSNDFYVGDVLPVIAAEVPVDTDGDGVVDALVPHAVTVRGPRAGTNSPPGQPGIFWGFEAKPGFAADDGENDRPALSTDPSTWPAFWPDNPDFIDPTTGTADWNGFFGRDQFNADLESYFWLDDNNDRELQTNYPGFTPDATRPERGGMALDMSIRGLQWSQFLAQDAIFWLYEVTNTGTTTYPRVAVGLVVGTLAGGDGDSQDDLAFFDQANRIVYSYDNDNSGNENQDVGYVGYGFLESPGDPNNGIDDDGDGDPTTSLGVDIDGFPIVDPALAGSDNTFAAPDFLPRVLAVGDPLVLIDAETDERSVVYVTAGSQTVVSQGREYTVAPGTSLQETETVVEGQLEDVVVTEKNLVDEDLDGIIDEDADLHFTRRAQNLQGEIVTLPALRYANYVGFGEAVQGRAPTRQDSVTYGLLNPMIDEARDDGIDNDGDWTFDDDTGADGLAGTGDEGEGDGVPTPGERNFDDKDVDESDQIGLSSFFYFTPPSALRMNDDQRLWEAMTPGFFTTNAELASQQGSGGVDGDFIFSSGYFRLEPGETLRFTLALVFGNDLQDITNNAITIQEIYDRNYQFARPPDRPTLRAVAGDQQVTLYWDNVAELGRDPILGDDFEGYKIYKSTDPFFRDPEEVTDVNGNPQRIAPLAQFDRTNGIQGVWPDIPPPDYTGAQNGADSLRILNNYLALIEQSESLQERTLGTPFYLGDDTGVRYTFTDTDVNNGQRYYYAVTAYDRGSLAFYPAENNLPISIEEDGGVITGDNVVEVIPNAPVAGYVPGTLVSEVAHPAGPATGDVLVQVLDPNLLRDGDSYRVTFDGGNPIAQTFTVVAGGDTLVTGAPIASAAAQAFEGLLLELRNDPVRLDSSGFRDPEGIIQVDALVANINQFGLFGRAVPYDYEIRFTSGISGRSFETRLGTRSTAPLVPATDTYFSVFNTTLDRPAQFAFLEAPSTRNGRFDPSEGIFIYEPVGTGGELVPTYGLRYGSAQEGERVVQNGDVFEVFSLKPFSERDAFVFTTAAAAVDQAAAGQELERIRVVPNPYVAAASWERGLPPTITSGRGERRIDFIHLPQGARIRIYNVRGALIQEIEHDSGISDGTASWDLRTREGLDVAYGIYFYHVEAPGIDGVKTGRIALIK